MKDYKTRMRQLEQFQGKLKYKYLRNLRQYTSSPTLSLDSLTSQEIPGYYSQGIFDIESDLTAPLQENVVKSCIDTLTSKIASQKVRPFFNPVRGSFKDIQIAKQLQQYFDILLDTFQINNKVTEAFRDACIFDTGYLFVTNENVYRALPWQVYFDPRQIAYNDVIEVAWHRKEVRFKGDYVEQWDYWNIEDKVHVVYVPSKDYYKKETFDKEKLPFVSIHYDKPVKGLGGNAIPDVLYGIQLEIDSLLQKIRDTSQLNPAMTFFVPEDSSVNAQNLNNRVGNVVTYRAQPGQNGSPVTVATPSFIDPSYLTLLQGLKEDAYNLVGITQLDATGQKPQGLNSGVALGTMENISSERFQYQLNNVIHMYTEVATTIIEIADGLVLPIDKNRISLNWSDVRKSVKSMKMQFSAAEALSKDPSEKLKQLQALASAGVIPQTRIGQLMELPDLESGYDIANNSINAVMTVIQRCIEHNDYDIPIFIPLDMLKQEILSCCLSLEAGNAEENQEDIKKLMKLYDNVVQMQNANQMQDYGNQQMSEQAEQYNAQSQQLDESSMALDNELNSMQNVVNGLQNGTMSPEQAEQFMKGMQ